MTVVARVSLLDVSSGLDRERRRILNGDAAVALVWALASGIMN